jgi:hypothetical protein
LTLATKAENNVFLVFFFPGKKKDSTDGDVFYSFVVNSTRIPFSSPYAGPPVVNYKQKRNESPARVPLEFKTCICPR